MKIMAPPLLAAGISLFFWLLRFPENWVNSWWGLFPLAAYFLSFAAGILGWGMLAEKKLGGGRAGVWLFSSMAAVAFAFALGHLGLLGAPGRWLFLLALHGGILLAPWGTARSAILVFQNPWLNGTLAFIFGLRFLTGYLPQAHGDPLLYHLMGPRLWQQAGVVHLNHDLPIPLLAATWEYFYLWPQALFAGSVVSVPQLVLAQIFSQWIHLVWGLYGAFVVFNQLVERKAWFQDELSRALPLLALLLVPSMQWTAALAKNDCGMGFWCLGAWLFWDKAVRHGQRIDWFWGGLFAGLALSAKISAILFLIPLAVVVACRLLARPHPWRVFSFAAAGGLAGFCAGALPVYVRNWVETQNPFYTMFAKWFPGPWVSQSWADHFNTHQPSGGTQWYAMMLQRFHQLVMESPMLWLWALLPLLLLRRQCREALAQWREEIALFSLAFALMFVAVMHDAEVRYFGAALWVAAGTGLGFAVIFLRGYLPGFQRAGQIVLLLALLGISKLPTHFLWKFFRTTPGEAYVLTHTGGEAKAWLRAHAGGRLVVVVGDNEAYYLQGVRAAVLTERPDIDRATYRKKNLAEFMMGLCETSRASLLLDVRAGASMAARFPDGPWPQAVLFEAAGVKIYDLVKLQSIILGKDVGCGQE